MHKLWLWVRSNDLLAKQGANAHLTGIERQEADMRDEFDGRFWAENHQVMSDGIDTLIAKIIAVFERLRHSNFDAPWDEPCQR